MVPFADLFNHLTDAEHVHFTGDTVIAGSSEDESAEREQDSSSGELLLL